MSYRIDEADVLDWLANYDGPPFHAVLSDPPYGLAFMGREWDSFGSPKEYQDWVLDWAALLIDRLYPGAVCLFFGGTRMWHRLACGLEDAGFEVYDTLMWLYGQGFPKSHNVSKAIDRAACLRAPHRQAGEEREVVGEHPTTKPRLSSKHGESQSLGSNWHGESGDNGHLLLTAPATTDAERWDGYGTALKPAFEPVILCRKPRTTTYAEHALEHGTGALWVDGCRIGTDEAVAAHRNTARNEVYGEFKEAYQPGDNGKFVNTQGRWPANLLLTHLDECRRAGDAWECAEGCPVAALDAQSGESVSKRSMRGELVDNRCNNYGRAEGRRIPDSDYMRGHNDTGGASRFFYTAKASRSERNAGLPDDMQNKHPTIKPLSITEYLARLVLPPELDEPRRILVPFSGTGSEMIGAGLAGWDEVTGIEMQAEAVEVAEYRLRHWLETARQGELL